MLNKGANPNKKHHWVSYHTVIYCIVHVWANSNSCDVYVSDEWYDIKILNTSIYTTSDISGNE